MRKLISIIDARWNQMRRQLDRLMTRWLSGCHAICAWGARTQPSPLATHNLSCCEHRDIRAPAFCDGELIVHGATMIYLYIYICEMCNFNCYYNIYYSWVYIYIFVGSNMSKIWKKVSVKNIVTWSLFCEYYFYFISR